jgi:ArsR family transcriptional regulator, arsenate/arsenite/antimonite-responsive transcriptional repressor
MKTTADFFKSLADETRLRLLVLLHEGREYCVCDLMHALCMPQSTVSRHLAYLKRHGWLQGRREGLWMHYSLVVGLDSLYRDQLDLVVTRLADTEICRDDRRRMATWFAEKNNGFCR